MTPSRSKDPEWCCGGGGGDGFLCLDATEKCIPMLDKCDGNKDCAGGEDEAPELCATTVTTSTATTFLVPCAEPKYFQCTPDCNDASDYECCIEQERLCDGSRDCANGRDEGACSSPSTAPAATTRVRPSATSSITTAAPPADGKIIPPNNNSTIPTALSRSKFVVPVVVCVLLVFAVACARWFLRRNPTSYQKFSRGNDEDIDDDGNDGDDGMMMASIAGGDSCGTTTDDPEHGDENKNSVE